MEMESPSSSSSSSCFDGLGALSSASLLCDGDGEPSA